MSILREAIEQEVAPVFKPLTKKDKEQLQSKVSVECFGKNYESTDKICLSCSARAICLDLTGMATRDNTATKNKAKLSNEKISYFRKNKSLFITQFKKLSGGLVEIGSYAKYFAKILNCDNKEAILEFTKLLIKEKYISIEKKKDEKGNVSKWIKINRRG